MKYFEFGTENRTTLLLLNGVYTTQQLSFSKHIKVAERKYHIIAVAEDGFNTDEPEVNAVSVIAEARKITEYHVDKFDGKIDIILGESLGGMIMTEILLDPRIKVHTAIADGYTIANAGFYGSYYKPETDRFPGKTLVIFGDRRATSY